MRAGISFYFLALAASLGLAHPATTKTTTNTTEYEYIIIGSGAGGGTLAARLAINGASVLLIEAGDDQGTSAQESIPAFFPAASEYAPMAWDFYVRHYPDEAREKLNTKATYETAEGDLYVGLDPPANSTFKGIWYPRAATLGGSAAHNAMVTVYPHEEDWTLIQTLTGDATWAPANMRQYFERLEKNEYLAKNNAALDAGHGFNGWLSTEVMADQLITPDARMTAMMASAAAATNGSSVKNITTTSELDSLFPLDMNTLYPNRDSTDAIYRMVTSTDQGVRSSPREFVLNVANATNADGSLKYKLTLKTNTFVTKIRFSNDSTPVALGVDYLDGASQYSADPRASTATAGTPGSVNATKEVILAAGTFNTPQILKLSGIGPASELSALDIPVIANLPGVGANLEDHYEISAVIEYDSDFEFLDGCTFLETTPDACYNTYSSGSYANGGKGAYGTNLIPAAILRKSSIANGTRDQFLFGGPIKFTGYFQGYTAAAIADHKHWSWLSLKAHEHNKAGTVTLRSTNPLDTPLINFNYFDAGTTTDGADELDLQPQVEGISFIRKIYADLPAPYNNFTEVYPGANVTTTEEVEEFIKNESWGHHCTSTAKMGSLKDNMTVLDSQFRVRGVKGLRVVDASIFPQVPGFFPVVSVYMIAEKAADVILGL